LRVLGGPILGQRWEIVDYVDDVPLEVVQCPDSGVLDRARSRLLSRGMDLRSAPPFALMLARRTGGDSLCMSLSHVVGDGMSAIRLMRSIACAYAGVADAIAGRDPLEVRDLSFYNAGPSSAEHVKELLRVGRDRARGCCRPGPEPPVSGLVCSHAPGNERAHPTTESRSWRASRRFGQPRLSDVSRISSAARSVTRRFGVDLVRFHPSARDDASNPLPRDFDTELVDTIRGVEHATMTSAERLEALVRSVEWIERRKISGAVVECGVWRGGSVMAVARTLRRLGNTSRDLYLYDTFAGMTAPDEMDRHYDGRSAEETMSINDPSSKNMSEWCKADLGLVRRNVESTGYPPERLRYIEGPVEQTIPHSLPGSIALLRLDTDFYASTRHELQHLYPLIPSGGVVIIDDYGAWQGARRAVDEFLVDRPEIFLHRLDVTGRLFIKP
jgi:O-methyltransferase